MSFASGYKYWGPGNTVHGFNTEQLSSIDVAARRHDLDVGAAMLIADDRIRADELYRSDQKFLRKIEKLYSRGDISLFERYMSRAVGSPLSKMWYKILGLKRKKL